jgi:hypothetical protein
MPNTATARARIATAAALALVALALPASAHAAAGPASLTVSSCGGDVMGLAGRVAAAGRSARRVRGARLQMRFQAMPLFGLPRTGAWRDMGAKKSATANQVFNQLGANSWIGVLSWRFKRGSKTVLSGDQRSEALRVGQAKGSAFCTVVKGFRLPDSVPPELFPVPADELWHRAPAYTWVVARDEFPGVAKVFYRLDGGSTTEIRNGAPLPVEAQGVHTLEWSAIDVDGNSASRTSTLRVDNAAPTKPQLTRPFSATVNTTPAFQWTASTDSGSGLRGYILTIRNAANGAQIAQVPADAGATSITPQLTLQDGTTYTAVLTAIDNTSDAAFTTDSDTLTFRVDKTPEVASSDPVPNAVLTGGRKDGNLVLNLDRPADPSTVSLGTVVLARGSGTTPAYSLACSSPCSTITVDPSGTLPEGRYTLSLNGLKSEEGATFANPGLKFAVAFLEDGGSATANPCTGGDVIQNELAVTLAASADEAGVVEYDWSSPSGNGSGGVRVLRGATQIAESTHSATGSGHGSLAFTVSSGSNGYTIQYWATCPLSGQPTTINASNVVATRVP